MTVGTEDRVKALRGTYPTEAEAISAAAAEYQRLQRQEYSLEITQARANPALTAETPAICQGWGKQEIDGTGWLITRVAYSLSESGI